MRRRKLVIAALLVAVVTPTAYAVASHETVPEGSLPRVCWFSDYANAKLSNKCTWRGEERRWYMTVDGREVPADTQRMAVANLCHYFAGTECPTSPNRGRDAAGSDELTDTRTTP